MIDSTSLRQLQSDLGREALARAASLSPTDTTFLAVVQQVSRKFPQALARAAVEQVILRRKAGVKFARAEQMFFERQALEQASTEAVAVYRAERMAGFDVLFDLGCGIGGDTLALARNGPVASVDRDRMRLLLLAANAQALGLERLIRPVEADLTFPAWRFPPRTAAFFDPARRKAGRRIHSVGRYDPPLEMSSLWLATLEGLAVKVSPAVDLAELRGWPCEVEFISCEGELKEACLWFAGLRRGERRATLLPGPHTLTISGDHSAPVAPPRTYLYEPDPAVMRAGLVGELADRIGASQIDPSVAYLTSDERVYSPFARAYRVVEVFPANLRTLRAVLRERGVGKLTLKKRGSAVDVENYTRRLHLDGPEEATLILTRAEERKVALLVERLHPTDP
jgi:hypothetical protein